MDVFWGEEGDEGRVVSETQQLTPNFYKYPAIKHRYFSKCASLI